MSMLHSLPSSPILILVQAQSNSTQSRAAQEFLWPTFGHLLWKLTRSACRRYCLHWQDHEEVFAEAIHQVVNPDYVRFSPDRGKPTAYFLGLVQNAAHKVQAQRVAGRPARESAPLPPAKFPR